VNRHESPVHWEPYALPHGRILWKSSDGSIAIQREGVIGYWPFPRPEPRYHMTAYGQFIPEPKPKPYVYAHISGIKSDPEPAFVWSCRYDVDIPAQFPRLSESS
jgi:hypothetical protein